MKRFKRNAGFTLVEIITVLVIIGIMAAIAVPSVAAYLQMGYQTNRMSIARTIFLAAQNQLTEKRITGELENSVYGAYNPNVSVYEKLKSVLGVPDPDSETSWWHDYGAPGSTYSYTDPEGNTLELKQEQTVQYISMRKGERSGPVFDLLNPVVVDKSILNEAILIEYNIKTGIVLSAFFGDRVAETEDLDYGASTDNRSVVGSRGGGTSGYQESDNRRQGYYGVGETGTLNDPLPEASIMLLDAVTTSLPDAVPLANKVNALYARITIARDALNTAYTLSLEGMTTPLTVTFVNELSENGNSIFCIENDTNKDYVQFVWIIDYVNGDTRTPSMHTIFDTETFDPSGITASLSVDGSTPITSNEQLPYYYAPEGTGFSVLSVRHLYNIRHNPGLSYTQAGDIDVEGNGVTYFLPIPSFSGEYNGLGYTISNLIINNKAADNTAVDNAGLFAHSSGTISNVNFTGAAITGANNVGVVAGTATGGTISGITVEDSDVTGKAYVGVVAGNVTGGAISNVTVTGTTIVTGTFGVGGVAGQSGGTISNATVTGAAVKSTGTGTIGENTGSFTGGIAGNATAAITDTLFNGGTVTGADYVGGIAGYTTAAISNVTVTGTFDAAGTESTATISGTYAVGGIVGEAAAETSITNVRVNGIDVKGTGSAFHNIGGVAGIARGVIGDEDTRNDITVVDTRVNGKNRVGGVAGAVTGSAMVNNAGVTGITVEGQGDYVGGIAGVASGGLVTVSVDSSTITGELNWIGGVAGLVQGSIDGALVQNSTVEKANKTVDGAVGGIAGVVDGTVNNVTFISSSDSVPVTGTTNTGGIAGANTGTVSNALYLALAPKSAAGSIIPITATAAGVTNAYYLSGDFIRPTEVEVNGVTPSEPPLRDGYNLETVTGAGAGFDTWDFYSLFNQTNGVVLGNGWARYAPAQTGDKPIEGADNVDSTKPAFVPEYPYPFVAALAAHTPEDPGWPIALNGDNATARFFYAEQKNLSDGLGFEYDDGLIGSLEGQTAVVVHDSYGVNVQSISGRRDYTLTLGTTPFTVTVDAAAQTVAVSGGTSTQAWPFLFYTDEETSEDCVRVFIPNREAEPLSQGAEIDVSFAGSRGNLLQDGMKYNPLFPPAAYNPAANVTAIRTPRHIDNIDASTVTLAGNYRQMLDVTFLAYRRELTGSDDDLDLDNTTSMNTLPASPVGVIGTTTFSGTYDGGSLEVRSLTVAPPEDSDNRSNIGLFSQSSGTIQNIIMFSPAITGWNSIGSVASTNSGSITNVTVTGAEITGANFVGIVAGTSNGTITNATVNGNTTIEGTSNVGGVAGNTSAAITNATVGGDTTIEGTSNVGGIAGTASAAITNATVGTVNEEGTAPVTVTVTGTNRVGGIVGITSAPVGGAGAAVTVQNTQITGNALVGGVAGLSSANINTASVTNTNVTSTGTVIPGAGFGYGWGGSFAGGVVGYASKTSAVGNVTVANTTVNGTSYVGGVAGTNGRDEGDGNSNTDNGGLPINNAAVNSVTVTGTEQVGGIAGNSEGGITNSTVSQSTVSGTIHVGGAAGYSRGNISGVTVSGSAVTGTNVVNDQGGAGGLAGAISHRDTGLSAHSDGFLSNSRVYNVTVNGKSNVGGAVGKAGATIDGVIVSETTVNGGDRVGGIVGMMTHMSVEGGAEERIVTNSVFVNSSNTPPVTGGERVGGIVGERRDSKGIISNVLYLALAPKNTAGNIIPISVDAVADITNAYYLMGEPVRPDTLAAGRDGYNLETVTGAGKGYNTWEFYDLFNQTDGVTLGTGWTRYSGDELQSMSNVNSKSSDYQPIYPYPYVETLSAHTPADPEWPIALTKVSQMSIKDFYYYEKYSDGNYGLWGHGVYGELVDTLRYHPDDNPSGNGLDITGRTILETGYVTIRERPLENKVLYVGGSDGKHYRAISGENPTDGTDDGILRFKQYGTGDAVIDGILDAYPSGDGLYAATLPLGGLDKRYWRPNAAGNFAMRNGSPLTLMYADKDDDPAGQLDYRGTGENILPVEDGFMLPLFAKGIYLASKAENVTQFIVRTPLHMRNIARFGGDQNNNYNVTAGKTFVQELDLNFKHTGIGVSWAGSTNADMNAANATAGNGGTAINMKFDSQPSMIGYFSGTYDGHKHKAEGITVELEGNKDAGLIRYITTGGMVKDLRLANFAFNGTAENAGALTHSNFGTVDGCVLEGSTFAGAKTVGGLVGTNNDGATVKDSGAKNSSVNGGDNVGGVIGNNLSSIDVTGCYNESTASGIHVGGSSFVGGIIGKNGSAAIIGAAASGTLSVSGTGDNNVGGIVGETSGKITGSSFSADLVNGRANVGGIAGKTSAAIGAAGEENRVTVSGGAKINGTGGNVGGIVGSSTAPVTNAYVEGTAEESVLVTGGSGKTGGIVGDMSAEITDCHVTYTTIKGTSYTGGVAGYTTNDITNVTVEDATLDGTNYTGGIVGTTTKDIANVTVTGTTTIKGTYAVGGVAGQSGGTITDAHINGADVAGTGNGTINISGTDTTGSFTGGIAGYATAAIGAAGETPNITVTDTTVTSTNVYTGGVAGYTTKDITNVTVEDTTVTGTSNVGGIAGYTTGVITNAHVSGNSKITGTYAVGGVAGQSGGTITDAHINGADVEGTGSGTISISGTNTTGSFTGGVAGYATEAIGEAGATPNITVTDTTVTGSYGYTGGVAGYTTGAINDCHVTYTNIKGTYAVGGVAGQSGTITNAHVSGVTVEGTGTATINISGTNISGSFTGGVAGYATGAIGAAGATPNVTVTDTTVNGTSYVGGVVGETLAAITNVTVTGSTAVTGTGNNIGGIVGDGRVGAVAISNAHVSGNVTVTGQQNVGGIAGINYGTVNNCTVTGTMSGDFKSSTVTVIGVKGVGGVVGDGNDTTTLTNCTVTGIEVRGITTVGEQWVGGITGLHYIISSSSVRDSYIHGTGDRVGGITGSANFSVSNSTVHGSVVEGRQRVGGAFGFVGLADMTDILVSETTVSGAEYVGGIAGMQHHGSNHTSNVMFISTSLTPPITCSGSAVGGIVGRGDGNAPGYSNVLYLALAPQDSTGNVLPITVHTQTGARITNAYYLSGVGYNPVKAPDVAGEPLTTEQISALALWNANWEKREGYPYPILKQFETPSSWPEANAGGWEIVQASLPELREAAPLSPAPSQGDLSADDSQWAAVNQDESATDGGATALAFTPAMFLFERRKHKREM